MTHFPRQLCSIRSIAAVASVVLLVQSFVRADSAGDFAGTFSDGKLTATFARSDAGYAGTIALGAGQYPATATATGDALTGSFNSGGRTYGFTARMDSGRLIVVSGGMTYTLSPIDGNPLTQPPQASDASTSATAFHGLPALGDFKQLGATSTGQTLFIKLPDAKTLESAITQTADAIGKCCDAKPQIIQAFAGAQTKTQGGAGFDVKSNGQDLRGLIFCNAGAQGGSATVILALSNAPKSDMAALFGFMPAPIKLQTHNFPDGSGSIDLPADWTTPSTSATFGIVARGPDGAAIVFGNTQTVYTPDCRLVRNAKQTYQMQLNNYNNQMRSYQQQLRMHAQFPNTPMPREPQAPQDPTADPNQRWPRMNFCQECSGAEEVLKYWYPIGDAKAQRAGGPYTTLDKIIEVVPADPNPLIAGSKSGVAYLAVSDHDGDKVTRIRTINRISTAPIMANECWQMTFTNMRAPDAVFDRDLPLMNAILTSVKLNMDVVNKQISDAGAQVRKMGEDNERELLKRGKEFQDAQAQNFNNFESQIAAQQQAMHDSTSDYIEYIGGVRDVYDNATGKMLSVDLFHSDAITDGLNTLSSDPGRFVQIPLRYER